MIEIPLGLRQSIQSGNCILFLGAGIGNYLRNSDGEVAPDGRTLAKNLADHFGIDCGEQYYLPKIAQIVEIRHGRIELETFVRRRLSNLIPDCSMKWIAEQRWKAIYTTNFDNGVQLAFDYVPKPAKSHLTITSSSEMTQYDSRLELPIYHLHGSLFTESQSPIIITTKDYPRYKEQRRMMFEQLKLHIATSTILYVGYSNTDPNWDIVISEISEEFFPEEMPASYRIDPFANDIDIEILQDKGVNTLKCSFEEFVGVARVTLDHPSMEQNLVMNIKDNIPDEFLDEFDRNPVAVARLLRSWEYVNNAPFNLSSNIKSFLRGDKPNWALIASSHQFERDIEEEAYESLLDFATDSSERPFVSIILGTAGYGTTTLMMSLATKLVRDRAGWAFFLKPGQELREGDIEFALGLAREEKVFFFIDDAAQHASIIRSIRHRYRESKTSVMFVLGERTNEWRQAAPRVSGSVYQISALSDGEIERLIDCLTRHGELNRLEDLERELQIAAIKQNYNRELLVAIREATEGTSFDAIIEDEFRGIADDFARRLYLIVCCFYQHGGNLRDSLLAQLLGSNLTDMYITTKDALEGIVIYDCYDEDKGIYMARARHRTIAEIVWMRCGLAGDKEDIIQSSLATLNLNYRLDKMAFEAFVRTDKIVDSLRTLEGKIQYFEKACTKAPDSPYVRQHYPRMLLREDKPNVALSQIEHALKLDDSAKVLYHTRGVVLSRMALSAESVEIGRRWMLQSEESYRRALSIHARDEYSYQGLAQLYIGWATRVATDDESIEYITKAEAIINEGMRVVRNKEGLWIESANIQRFLGDQPSRIKSLENAVRDTPGSIVARNLLATVYNEMHQYDKTLSILHPVIKDYPDEFRAHLAYAMALLGLAKPAKEAIAILYQGSLYGLSDPRFIATLGGLLVMDEQFSEADKVFHESVKRDIDVTDLMKVYFQPRDPKNPKAVLRLKGEVKTVRAGYSILLPDSYPEFLCPGSKYNGLIMKTGLRVSFEPAFTAKRRIALNPELLK